MKTLELNQMEILEGGVECSSWLGLATGFFIATVLITATAGVGAALVGAALASGALTGASSTCIIN